MLVWVDLSLVRSFIVWGWCVPCSRESFVLNYLRSLVAKCKRFSSKPVVCVGSNQSHFEPPPRVSHRPSRVSEAAPGDVPNLKPALLAAQSHIVWVPLHRTAVPRRILPEIPTAAQPGDLVLFSLHHETMDPKIL
jgi:hypothetical protein